MNRYNLLPILRRRRIWITLTAALLLLFLSVGLMDKTAADDRAEIERIYKEMDVHFLLNAGRRSLVPGFSISLTKLRRIEHWEYFENFGCSDIYLSVLMDPNNRLGQTMMIGWTYDPETTGIHVIEGKLDEGIWLPEAKAEQYGVGVGDMLTVYSMMSFGVGKRAYGLPVAAITDASVAYLPEELFDKLYDWIYVAYSSDFDMTDLHFSLKKEYNPMMAEIEQKLQALLNTPNPYDRNRDVTVNYNASEIDGMLKPLEKSIASAEFFGRLFRMVLPVVAYVIEFLAVLGFRNEIGVRRFLGDSRTAVFFGIWLPTLLLCMPGYICVVILLLTSLGQHISLDMLFWHFLGTVGFTALVTGILCAIDPQALLREKEYE